MNNSLGIYTQASAAALSRPNKETIDAHSRSLASFCESLRFSNCAVRIQSPCGREFRNPQDEGRCKLAAGGGMRNFRRQRRSFRLSEMRSPYGVCSARACRRAPGAPLAAHSSNPGSACQGAKLVQSGHRCLARLVAGETRLCVQAIRPARASSGQPVAQSAPGSLGRFARAEPTNSTASSARNCRRQHRQLAALYATAKRLCHAKLIAG